MNILVLHYGMGKSGSRVIEFIRERHREETVEIARLEPIKEHGLYGWLVRSFIPGLKASVKPVDLGGCELLYLIAPKWGYNCPPINGFIGARDLKGLRVALIVTYSKGDPSGYSRRLAKRIERRGGNLLAVLEVRREEVLSGSFVEKMQSLCDRAAEEISGGANLVRSHEHEIVFMGMVNVNRDNYLQGVVDVWRCRQCRKLFCEDRRYGEGLKPDVGFEEIPDDEQWAILTCTDIKGVFMESLPVKPGKRLEHTCKSGEKRAFTIRDDWSIDPAEGETVHGLYMVKNYLNRGIEAGYYRIGC